METFGGTIRAGEGVGTVHAVKFWFFRRWAAHEAERSLLPCSPRYPGEARMQASLGESSSGAECISAVRRMKRSAVCLDDMGGDTGFDGDAEAE